MLPSVNNDNCYEYLKRCTGIYDDVYMMQHFGVKYRMKLTQKKPDDEVFR